MMFTREDLDSWLRYKLGASNGYSQLTKKILQYGGGEVSTTDPYAWLFRVPPTVSAY